MHYADLRADPCGRQSQACCLGIARLNLNQGICVAGEARANKFRENPQLCLPTKTSFAGMTAPLLHEARHR